MFAKTAIERFVLNPNRLIRTLLSIFLLAGLLTGTSVHSANAASTTLFANKSKFLQFNNWDGLTSNHSPREHESASDVSDNGNEIKLTTRVGGKNGFLWSTETVDISKQDFVVMADMYFGDQDAAGADGVDFALRQLSSWPNDGIDASSTGDADYLNNGEIHVFFDTWKNGSEMDNDHLSIYSVKSNGTTTYYSDNGNGVALVKPDGTPETNLEQAGVWFPMSFKWTVVGQTRKLGVYAGKLTGTYSLIQEVSIPTTEQDLNTFAWGFQGRTGGAFNDQSVRNIEYFTGPGINSDPSSQGVAAGTAVTLSSTFTTGSDSSATRNWQVSTDNGSIWNDIPGATSGTYTFAATTDLNKNQYRYFVESSGFSITLRKTSAPATIRVWPNSSGDTAMTFSGTNYLTSSTETEFDVTTGTTFTLSAWIYPTTISGTRTIAAKEGQYSLYISNTLFNFSFSGVTAGNGSFTGTISSDRPARANQWQHVEISRNGTSAAFYLNGQLVYSDTSLVSNSTISNGSNQFTIGGKNGVSENFIGQIDQVSLTSADRSGFVQSDMNTYQPTDDNLIAHYDFNEGANSTVFNRKSGSTSATDLTLSSGSNAWPSIETTTATGAYKFVTFKRSYLVSSGGWTTPVGITRISAVVVAGGGAGGADSDDTGWMGGGGGAGGYRYETQTVSTNSEVVTVKVGLGGRSGQQVTRTSSAISKPTNGLDSQFKSITSTGGGAGGISYNNANTNGADGGSGGGGATYSGAGGSGTTGQGNNGGAHSGNTCCASGGGGGAGSAGGAGTVPTLFTAQGGAAGDGVINPLYVSGSSAQYLAGGGAGLGFAFEGSAGTKGGTASFTNATANTGSGGGGGGSSGSPYWVDKAGGFGGSGIVIVRYLNISVPAFTALPAVDTTTAGKTYAFNAGGSAQSSMVRSYLWQSSSNSGSSWTTIAGANSETYTTSALETTTSGSQFKYRVVVTDTDTAGNLISDTSTSYLVINPRITISGTTTLTRNYGADTSTATYTFTNGTGTRTPTFSPNNRSGIAWSSTSSAGATLTVGKNLSAGTYYETMTVTDGVGSITSQMLTITVNGGGTLTVQVDTVTGLTYGATGSFSPTSTISGLVNGDTATAANKVTYSYTYTGVGTTCATGGYCAVGDLAPGGGYVFYVSDTVIDVASGISSGGLYLATAPKTWNGGSTDPNAAWGCGGTTLSGSFSNLTGSGAENTRLITAGCATAGIAARRAADLTFGGYSDWFLPSLDELTFIYSYLKTKGLSDLESWNYWSSTQSVSSSAGSAKYWWFGAGATNGETDKNNSAGSNMYVRPIRAFSPAVITSSVAGITNAGTYTITPSALTLDSPASTSNYTSLDYRSATIVVSKAAQTKIGLVQNYTAAKGTPRTLVQIGGSGTGARTETLTATSLAAGCSLSGLTLTVNPTTITSCDVVTSKAFDTNYFADSATVTVYLIEYVLSIPQGNVGGGGEIGLNGQTLFQTLATAPPTLSPTSYSGANNSSITITGTGFVSGYTVAFQDASGAEVTAVMSSVTSTSFTVIVPSTAVSGPMIVRNNIGTKRGNFTLVP